MKKKLLFLFLPLLSVLLISAYKKKVLPPGTVELSEGYYMDKMQISNAAWKEYVYWNKRTFGDSSVEYQTSKINYAGLQLNSALLELYYNHPAFDEYPLVIFNREKAKSYCKWRSDRVNELLYLQRNKKTSETKEEDNEIPQVFTYRLPTLQERSSIKAVPQKKIKRKLRSAQKWTNDETLNEKAAALKALIPFIDLHEKGQENELGILNLHGEVAEHVSDALIYIGDDGLNCIDDRDDDYAPPLYKKAFVSFRCVCEGKAD